VISSEKKEEISPSLISAILGVVLSGEWSSVVSHQSMLTTDDWRPSTPD
jgi:hypothetical protein